MQFVHDCTQEIEAFLQIRELQSIVSLLILLPFITKIN
jgi:hypothetical protein